MTAALVRTIRSLPDFPEDGQIEIVEAGRGSFVAKLAIYSGIAGGLASVGSLGLSVVNSLKKPDSEIARCVAWTMVDDGVTKAGIRCGGSYEVLKSQMPAVARLISARGDDPSGEATRARSGVWTDLSAALDASVPDDVGRSMEQVRGSSQERLFTNVPPDPRSAQLPGRFVRDTTGLSFVQQNGERGQMEEEAEKLDPPIETSVVARLSAVRGSRGGWADRRLRLHDWFPANGGERQKSPRSVPDIWQRGGDDEEFDLLPGQQSEDLRNVSDPGHDLYDESSFIEGQPVMAYPGELITDAQGWMLVTKDGDSFILDGEVEPSDAGAVHDVVVVGRAGLDVDERGRRRLLAEGIYPAGK